MVAILIGKWLLSIKNGTYRIKSRNIRGNKRFN